MTKYLITFKKDNRYWNNITSFKGLYPTEDEIAELISKYKASIVFMQILAKPEVQV